MTIPAWVAPHLREFYFQDEKTLLATCMYGEAAGESYEGKFAVGCVIRNRVRTPGWWGDSYHRVILAPKQFSCFNSGAPTLKMMKNPKGKAWADCLKAAEAILSDAADITGGASHYFRPDVVQPAWAKRMKRTVTIGHHEFYLGYGV